MPDQPDLQGGDESAAAAYAPPPGLEDMRVPSLLTPCVFYDEGFLPESEATSLFEDLRGSVAWEKNDRINRWVALYGDEGIEYRYRDQPTLGVVPWSEPLARVKRRVEEWYAKRTGQNVAFNVCLLNFYENGEHRIGWHYDREEIGRTTPIASVSLGDPRKFIVKAKEMARGKGSKDEANIELANGSLLMMESICQELYVHSLPRDIDAQGARVNLTFRSKLEQTAGERDHESRAAPPYLTNPPPALRKGASSESSGQIFGDDEVAALDTCPEPSTVHFLVNAQLGAEIYVAAEVTEFAAELDFHAVARPWGLPGFVAVATRVEASEVTAASEAALLERLLKLRSGVHVMRYHHHFRLTEVCGTVVAAAEANFKPAPRDGKPWSAPPAKAAAEAKAPEASADEGAVVAVVPEERSPELRLSAEDLYAHVKALLDAQRFHVATLEAGATCRKKPSFRVSCVRIGSHAFQSAEVEREVGGALQEYYDCKADMKRFDVHVRADVVGDFCVLGTQCNVQDLSLRHKLEYTNRVTIKSNVAYMLLRAAGVKAGDTVLDPFCGSGTLLLEAAAWLDGAFTGIGLDMNRRAANGARANAEAEGFGDCLTFKCSDARALRKHCADESVDALVTNVPWGVQTGNFVDLEALYEVVLRTGWYVLKPGGRMVLFVLRGIQMMTILRRLSGRFRTFPGSFQVVRTTNNLPTICVVEKVAHDFLHKGLSRQLFDMSKYVNLAPEMYRAVHDIGAKHGKLGDDTASTATT